MTTQLKIYIKQAQQFNSIGQPVIYVGTNPMTLTAVVNGTLSTNRQWPNFGNFTDVTSDCSDPTKLQLTWTLEGDSDAIIVGGEIQQKKSASGKITFEGETFRLIKQWLFDDVSASLNAVQVKIVHVGCGSYEDYYINADDITYCETNPQLCTFDVVLRQKDDVLNCIKKTIISDNWQGWFQPVPANGKKHPRFSYCNEQRPNGLMIAVWYLLSLVSIILTVILLPLGIVLAALILLLNGIISVINVIISAVNVLPGVNIATIDKLPVYNPFTVFDDIAQTFIDTAGCGREHPSPLVRDYISNVCSKCGLSVTAASAPLFFSNTIQLETSANGIVNVNNPHFNACYFNAPVKRGVRHAYGSDTATVGDYYIYDNRPLLTLDEFLNQLSRLYNTAWRIVNNTLYIYRKDAYKTGNIIFDFSENAPDKSRLLEGICYEWNGRKYPAFAEGLYQKDPTDKPGNESLRQMNDFLSYGNVLSNPNYEGKQDKVTDFAGTKFRLDGASDDYVLDAFQVVCNLQLVTIVGALTFIPTRNAIENLLRDVADYALLIEGETTLQPKILLWDGNSYNNAKCIRPYSAAAISGQQMPTPNQKYGNAFWPAVHPPITDVYGQGFGASVTNNGYYVVSGFFGLYTYERPAMLVNYPMYFAPGFQNTMWDWFHWIDDPQKNPKLNMSVTAKVELCCDTLKTLGVFGSAQNIALGEKIKVNSPYFQDAEIVEIDVDYDTESETGQSITIKANL